MDQPGADAGAHGESQAFSRRLQHLHQVDPSAVDPVLARAEAGHCNHPLLELNTIQQSLRDVADDPAMTQVSRERARQLLAQEGTPLQVTAPCGNRMQIFPEF